MWENQFGNREPVSHVELLIKGLRQLEHMQFVFWISCLMLQIQVHLESSQLIRRHKGTEACLSSSTMMLPSRPWDCQCVDFRGPSSYLSRKKSGWLLATVWNTWRAINLKSNRAFPSCYFSPISVPVSGPMVDLHQGPLWDESVTASPSSAHSGLR